MSQAKMLAFLLCWVCIASAIDTDLNHFVLPPPSQAAPNYSENPVVSINSTQVVQWVTNSTFFYIALFQQVPGIGGIQGISLYDSVGNSPHTRSFEWTVQTIGLNSSLSPVYFFWLNPGASDGFTSDYFNISRNDQQLSASSFSTTTTSTASTHTSSVVSSTSTTINATVASASNIPTSTNDTGGHDKKGTDVGLGVGIGVGVTIVLATAILSVLRWMKKRKATSVATPPPEHHIEPYADHKHENVEVLTTNMYEMPANTAAYELSGSPSDAHAVRENWERQKVSSRHMSPPVELE